MRLSKTQVAVYSLGHFVVDLSCATYMMGWLRGSQDWALILLLYNFCAFALQMPIGIIADKWNRNACMASLGCLLIVLSFLFHEQSLFAAMVLGVGNGCFHIGGGLEVLNESEEKMGLLGIFVSPGAFGIFFGTLIGKSEHLNSFGVLLALALVLFGISFLFLYLNFRQRRSLQSINSDLDIDFSGKASLLAACFLVVVLRSHIGMILTYPWKTGALALAAVCMVVFGKALGGMISDKAGVRKTVIVSLGAATVLFLIGELPIAGLGAMLLFNMTMPITLWIMAKLLPGAKGFAFGILTFALFIGFLPKYYGYTSVMPGNREYAAGALLSLMIMIYIIIKGKFICGS